MPMPVLWSLGPQIHEKLITLTPSEENELTYRNGGWTYAYGIIDTNYTCRGNVHTTNRGRMIRREVLGSQCRSCDED